MTEITIFRTNPEFRSYDARKGSWNLVDVSLKNSELDCLIPDTPFVFDIDPEQWVKENNMPLVFLGKTVGFGRKVFFYHPKHESSEGYIEMTEEYEGRKYTNIPDWLMQCDAWKQLFTFGIYT